MTAERFGALDLAATTNTFLMSSPSGSDCTVNVSFANRNSTEVMIRLALVDEVMATAVANLSDEDYLEYDTEILGNEVLERTGIVVPEDHSLVVFSNTASVSVIAYGFQEARI